MCIIKGQIKLRTFFVCALYRSGKEYFCSIEKSFAQQEKKLRGNIVHCWAASQHIRIISEGSRDTYDWSNDLCKFSFDITLIYYILKYIKIENRYFKLW